MNLFLSKLIGSIIQIILFTLIPFIWWLITARGKSNFFEWIGLKKVEYLKRKEIMIWIAGISVIFLSMSVFILYSLKDVETATSDFAGLGVKAIPAIFIYAVLNTSLPEELLFRGFLLKRISNRFGLNIGNIIQSIIFGAIHGVMFFSYVGLLKAILITIFTGIVGWCMGYVNEKKAHGSILPSWCIHATANIFSAICSAFSFF